MEGPIFGNVMHNELAKGMGIDEVIALSKQALAEANTELTKYYQQSTSATSGITAYDLEAPAKMLYPVLTPHRNRLARVPAKGGIQANWRAVTGVNTTNLPLGISQGNRAAVSVDSTADYTAAYKGDGLDQMVTWEAQYAAEGFEDIRSLAAINQLKAVMIREEKMILLGNTSVALTQVGTVAKSLADAGGSLSDSQTIYIVVVGLTGEAWAASSLTSGCPTGGSLTLASGKVETRVSGTSQPSAEVSQATGSGGAGNAHQISISWPYLNGAVAYAVYTGTATGQERLAAIVQNNSYIIKTNPSTTSQLISALPSTDQSQNPLAYDGYLSLMYNYATTKSYVVVQATGTPGTGTPLTGDGYGGIKEFEQVLQYLYNTWRLGPTEIWWSSVEAYNASPKILAGAQYAAQQFHFVTEQSDLAGGVIVKNYWNRYGLSPELQSVPLKIDPNMPPGTVFFNCEVLPYPLSNVTNVAQIKLRRDYHQVEWPPTDRQWPTGTYWDGVMQHYAPFSMAMITNIANG